MLILVFADVQYSQKAIFSFEKGLLGQNDSSGSLHPVKKFPPSKILGFPPLGGIPPLLTAIWKTLRPGSQFFII